MNVNRRYILAGLAAGVAGLLGLRATVWSKERRVRDVIAAEFGPDIAAQEDARLFAEELAAALPGQSWEAVPASFVAVTFVSRTTVIRALETGDALVYLGLDGALETPCANPLSANWL